LKKLKPAPATENDIQIKREDRKEDAFQAALDIRKTKAKMKIDRYHPSFRR